MRRALVACALAALALPSVAVAHVTVTPPFLEDGKRTTLVFSSPNERPGHAVTAFTVTVPAGIDLAEASPSPGWTLAIARSSATWSGGRIPPDGVVEFRVRALTRLEPDGLIIRAVQRYADGMSVPWRISLTILPAPSSPKEHLWPALIVGAVGLLAIGVGLTVFSRRGRTQARRV